MGLMHTNVIINLKKNENELMFYHQFQKKIGTKPILENDFAPNTVLPN
jgi:hypothetical protein